MPASSVQAHISARLPGPEHHFLINPYGLMFDEITASSLAKVDPHCNKLNDSPYSVNPPGREAAPASPPREGQFHGAA